MKRGKFLDSASRAALTPRTISEQKTKAHPALAALSEEFRAGTKWSGPETPPSGEGMVVRMIMTPHEEANPLAGVSVVFLDRSTHRGPPEEVSGKPLADLLQAGLNHLRPMPVDWLKAGAVIWDQAEVSVDPKWIAQILALSRADDAIKRAFMAALVSVIVTSDGTVDLEPVRTALATFIHSLPALAGLVEEAKWHLPYGDRTATKVLRPA